MSKQGDNETARANRIALADLSVEERSSLAWVVASSRIARGEDPREVLIWAIRNGVHLPDDQKARGWIADALEGKYVPKRGRGRPRKQDRLNLHQRIVEHAILEKYQFWLHGFQRDRETTWLRFEALRLRELHPDARMFQKVHDLGTEGRPASVRRRARTAPWYMVLWRMWNGRRVFPVAS